MSIRPRAIALVTSLELRQRVRSVRWYIALAVWFLLLCGMSLLVLLFSAWTTAATLGTTDDLGTAGRIVYSGSVLMLVFAMLLVIPALAEDAIKAAVDDYRKKAGPAVAETAAAH